jgi:hypothetical protein
MTDPFPTESPDELLPRVTETQKLQDQAAAVHDQAIRDAKAAGHPMTQIAARRGVGCFAAHRGNSLRCLCTGPHERHCRRSQVGKGCGVRYCGSSIEINCCATDSMNSTPTNRKD